MTAPYFNNSNGPFANVVDGYVYPQMIFDPKRAPLTTDVYPAGTRWQDNSVNPPVQYYTTGAGLWNELPNSSFGVSSVTGTANQITAAPTTGAVILSIPNSFVVPGSISATTTVTAGTGIVSTAGNIVATAGQVNAGTSITAGTTVTATLGNITATNGNLVLAAAGNKLQIHATTAASDSVGVSAAMSGNPGAVTVTSSAVTSSSIILYSRATTGGTPGQVSITAQAGGSFTLTSTGNETSTFNYLIIN